MVQIPMFLFLPLHSLLSLPVCIPAKGNPLYVVAVAVIFVVPGSIPAMACFVALYKIWVRYKKGGCHGFRG